MARLFCFKFFLFTPPLWDFLHIFGLELIKDNDMTTLGTIWKMTVRSAMLVVLAVVAIAITSCSDADDWWGDEATKEVFEKGISVSESGGEVNVTFAGNDRMWTPSVTTLPAAAGLKWKS